MNWSRGFVAALSCLLLVFISLPASAANIAWLSVHPTDDPVADAANNGYTMASDQGFVDLLRGAGHTVNRFVTQSPDQAFIDSISANDLVIVSRQVASGDYQDPPEVALWHSVSKPMMLMSGYILRANRLQLMSGNNIPDTGTAGPVILTAEVPSHPIFDGVALDGSNNMNFASYPISTPNGAAMRGISVITDPPAAGGTVLATVGTPADPAENGMLIGFWGSGATVGANTLAAPRMVFLAGTREPSSPNPIALAGVHDLTAEGDQLFLNAVDFMVAIPEPATATMLLLAIAGLGMWRKR
jgi:hypothetical protein